MELKKEVNKKKDGRQIFYYTFANDDSIDNENLADDRKLIDEKRLRKEEEENNV